MGARWSTRLSYVIEDLSDGLQKLSTKRFSGSRSTSSALRMYKTFIIAIV